MRLGELTGCRLAVWGAGREGREALRLLAPLNDAVLVVDAPDHAAQAVADEFGVPLHRASIEELCAVDVIVRSPGVSRYRAELAATRAAGVADTGLLALWLAERGPVGIVGVTGTKGKSTTSWLTAALLDATGAPAALAGNIGVPVTTVESTWARVVVEVSSYQAADVVVSPEVGVLTALGEDHLPWHCTRAQYQADKLNLFEHHGLRRLVVNGADPDAVRATTAHDARRLLAPANGWRLDGGLVAPDGTAVDTGPVLGRSHYALDLVMAIAAAEELLGRSLDRAAVDAVAAPFTGLPSRQQLVATVDGVDYVDDALASNPAATIAAIETFSDRPVVLILGGADRGVDHDELLGAIGRHVTRVVLFSDTGQRLKEAVAATGVAVNALATDDVGEAAQAAADWATPGSVVLFSPAAPTPAHLGTYEDRSRRYAEAVGAMESRRGSGDS